MEVFVGAEWVANNLDRVRLIDVRDSWEYDGIGHLPGAVNIPFDAFRAEDGDEGMLPGERVWRDLLEETGITTEDTLVAYDDTHGVFAARFLVTAELYGHEPARLRLLDGDYSAWSRKFETTRESPQVSDSEYPVDRPTDSPLVDYETVLDMIDSEWVILDTREEWEYEEGHIPGSVQLDWRELVDTEKRTLKSSQAIESVLADHGITPGTRVLLYCNTARRISHTYLVLRHLGYDELAFYEGSLTEWRERGGPVEAAATDS